jgi:cell division protein FtsL
MTLRIVLALVVVANVLSAIGIVFARHEHRQRYI